MATLVLATGAHEGRWVLRRGFERTGLFEVVAEVEDGLGCLTSVREHDPDLVVVDLDGLDPDEVDGLRLVALLGQEQPGLPVIVLTGPADPQRFEQALRSDAVGVVSRDAPVAELVAQVQSLLLDATGVGYPEPA